MLFLQVLITSKYLWTLLILDTILIIFENLHAGNKKAHSLAKLLHYLI